jgi:hypothetical protein
MRSSVQDLIQFGITTPGSSGAGSSSIESSSSPHARDFDPLGESLSFDTLLALAASLHRPVTDSLLAPAIPQAGLEGLVGPLGNGPSQASTWQAGSLFDAPLASMNSSGEFSGRHAHIHDLFTALTSPLDSSDLVQESPTLKKHQTLEFPAPTSARSGAAEGDVTVPIEFRPTRRVIPIQIDRPVETPGIPRQPREISTSPALRPVPADGSGGPELRIVARNDSLDAGLANDALPATRRLPDLRLVVSNNLPLDGAINTDLVDRLARGWRQSFSEDGIDFSDVEAQANGSLAATPNSLTRAGNESGAAPDFSEDSDGAAGQRPAVEPQHAPVVSLFSDFMGASPLNRETGVDIEHSVGVRQAVVEIPREVQRLERMGGTELSFSLRLHPEHLGQIDIEIQRSGDSWTVSITTADEGGRHALAAEMQRLESAFRDHNLSLERLTIVARAPEPVISAPEQAGQATNPDWHGAGTQDFMGNGNQDDGGWRGYGRQRIIGIDSNRDVGGEQEVTHSHTEASRSGIDIHI